MQKKRLCLTAVLILSGVLLARSFSEAPNGQGAEIRGWQKGNGWGWVWGRDDEVGALNAMTELSKLQAIRLVQQGKVYDLGVAYDRGSYKWPGHSPAEIISFRTPEGVKRQRDLPELIGKRGNQIRTAWHSCALFINDNVATQIDGLGHVTAGDDNHWYNGFKEQDWGGNWGIRKCDATTIPPIVARGVLIDVARSKNSDALPAHQAITPEDLAAALRRQNTHLRPGDVVLIRTGTLQFWGKAGHDPDGKIAEHDSAGINLDAAKWLVEQHGAIMVGSDTSGVEYVPTEADTESYRAKFKTFIPVHNYLLVEQGVHIAEFHYLEDLARDSVYEFCYIGTTNKIKGTTAGFTLRPIAIR